MQEYPTTALMAPASSAMSDAAAKDKEIEMLRKISNFGELFMYLSDGVLIPLNQIHAEVELISAHTRQNMEYCLDELLANETTIEKFERGVRGTTDWAMNEGVGRVTRQSNLVGDAALLIVELCKMMQIELAEMKTQLDQIRESELDGMIDIIENTIEQIQRLQKLGETLTKKDEVAATAMNE